MNRCGTEVSNTFDRAANISASRPAPPRMINSCGCRGGGGGCFFGAGNFPPAAASFSAVASAGSVVRIREILDPELRDKILAALAERRGCSVAAIPDWFELDDADFVDLLHDIQSPHDTDVAEDDDPRM